jgi:hypothetical protein
MAKVTETEFIEEKIKDIIGAMEALLAASKSRPGSVIAELLARAEMPSVIDGYGTGNRGEPTSGGDVGDPVHGTVVARAADVCGKCVGTGYVFKKQGRNPKKFSCPQCRGSGRRWADPVSDAVVSIRDCVTRIHVECKSIDKSRSHIGATVPKRERISSLQGNCLVCGTAVTGVAENRLRRGLDPECFLAWTSWEIEHSTDDPGADFHRFTKFWRKILEAAKRREEEAEAAAKKGRK